VKKGNRGKTVFITGSVSLRIWSGDNLIKFDCVQILHDRDHWVLTGRLNGKVMYMDSLSRTVSPNLTRQLCQLYGSSDSPTALPCSQQPNSNDCGLYAAAFAFEIATDECYDLMRNYDTSQMRQHLEECLTMGLLIPFPASHWTFTRETSWKKKSVSVYIMWEESNILDIRKHFLSVAGC